MILVTDENMGLCLCMYCLFFNDVTDNKSTLKSKSWIFLKLWVHLEKREKLDGQQIKLFIFSPNLDFILSQNNKK